MAAAKARVDAALQQVETFAVPAWDGAVGALDHATALAAAQLAVSLMREASSRTEETRTLDDAAADACAAAVSERWGILAAFLSPQRFAGKAVLGTYAWDPGASETDVAREAGTVVELLATAGRIRELLASGDQYEADEALGLSDGWRGRPVNFAFLSSALASAGVLEQLRGVACATGRSFTEQSALADAHAGAFGVRDRPK